MNHNIQLRLVLHKPGIFPDINKSSIAYPNIHLDNASITLSRIISQLTYRQQ